MLSQKYKAQMQPAGWRLPVRPGAGRMAGVGTQPWHLELCHRVAVGLRGNHRHGWDAFTTTLCLLPLPRQGTTWVFCSFDLAGWQRPLSYLPFPSLWLIDGKLIPPSSTNSCNPFLREQYAKPRCVTWKAASRSSRTCSVLSVTTSPGAGGAGGNWEETHAKPILSSTQHSLVTQRCLLRWKTYTAIKTLPGAGWKKSRIQRLQRKSDCQEQVFYCHHRHHHHYYLKIRCSLPCCYVRLSHRCTNKVLTLGNCRPQWENQ